MHRLFNKKQKSKELEQDEPSPGGFVQAGLQLSELSIKDFSTTVKQYYDGLRVNFFSENKPRFIIRYGDMFEIAKEYQNPVIHNFANNEYPGGPLATFTPEGQFVNIRDYGNTQEDQLIKRYREKIILPKDLYPIISKDKTALLYSYCQDLPPVITLPSIVNPNFKKPITFEIMLKRIELLMYSCCLNDNTLITGLWGCGAFGMKPENLAELWEVALKTFYHKPIDIVFVIYQDSYTKKYDNLEKLFSKINKD